MTNAPSESDRVQATAPGPTGEPGGHAPPSEAPSPDELVRHPKALTRTLRRLAQELGPLSDLSVRSGEDEGLVLRKALNLYGLALEAVGEGNRLVVVSPADEIVQEIEGIAAEGHAPPLTARR